ncbi:MAG: TonB C-terminal domain-containing protein [Kofleriaceae bacterium]
MLVAACGHATGGRERAAQLQLGPLPLADPAQPGGPYLASVALQLEPAWGQFLEDCRLRLPSDHALNRLKLEATAELVIDRRGVMVGKIVTPSGNPDFDRAVTDVLREAKVPAPPAATWSDDDHVYLRWLFARDRRQAGPATAELVHRELPVADALARFIAAHDLGRAARRIHDGNQPAVTTVMTAALRDAIATSADTTVQRAAVEAIGDAKLAQLSPAVAVLLDASDDQLRMAATIAVGKLGDRAVMPLLERKLAAHLAAHDRVAIADAEALVALGAEPAATIEKALPDPIALEAYAKTRRASPKVVAAMKGNALTRAAACVALGAIMSEAEIRAIGRGLADPDASVRAACAAIAPAQYRDKISALLRDRDRAVRATAVQWLGTIDPSAITGAFADPEPELRAAAWTAFAQASQHPAMLRNGLADPVAEVRLAAIPSATDDGALAKLAASDSAPEVRTRALEEYVRRAGRAKLATQLLADFAAAADNSIDRVRIARAWLLAK